MNKRELGSKYEDFACDYIKSQGGKILKRNYRVRFGEIDIIAEDNDYICFIEVKYRKDNKYGGPEAAVSLSKQKQICNISRYFLTSNNMDEYTPVRYDVITVTTLDGALTVKWYKNAFDYCL